MAEPKPPTTLELVWDEDLRFGVTTGRSAVVLDGNGGSAPSPMEFIAAGVAGCMAADIVSILQKGRHPMTGLRVSFSGRRMPEPPRRFTAIALQFHVSGSVPEDAVRRAIDLSRDKYCSAWHSMREDIAFDTQFTIVP